jgi:hypothetical protein
VSQNCGPVHIAAYKEQWEAERPQREMRGKALTVLQEFAHLPEPEGLELMHRVRARK